MAVESEGYADELSLAEHVCFVKLILMILNITFQGSYHTYRP